MVSSLLNKKFDHKKYEKNNQYYHNDLAHCCGNGTSGQR